MIQVEFTLQARELTRLARSKQLRLLRWVYVALGTLMILSVLFDGSENEWDDPLVFALPLLIFIVSFELLLPRMMISNYRKFPFWGKPVQYLIDDREILQKAAHSEMTWEWEAIRSAEESTDWFLLHPGPKSIYIALPKRAFSEEDARGFRELLHSKGLYKHDQKATKRNRRPALRNRQGKA